MNGRIIIFTAPSGSGKTTLVRHVLEHYNQLKFSISATTRVKRNYEIDKQDYHFMSKEEFRKKIDENAFLEWEEVYKDQLYGTLKSEIHNIWNSGHHCIFDIDVQGALNIKKQFPEKTLAIFVRIPSLDILRERLEKRGSENEEKINKRLAKASREMSFEENFDVSLVNGNLDQSKQQAGWLVDNFLNS